MKRVIIKGCAALLLGLFFVFQAVDAQATPVISLDVSDTDISVGESFSVEVRVDGIVASDLLKGFGFYVNSGDFSYIRAAVESPFTGPPLLSPVIGSTSPGIYGDDILLATLEFTAPSLAGGYSLGIETSIIGDASSSDGLFTENNRYAMIESVDMNVSSSPSAVPEPATLFLLGSGLAGTAALGRKFRG